MGAGSYALRLKLFSEAFVSLRISTLTVSFFLTLWNRCRLQAPRRLDRGTPDEIRGFLSPAGGYASERQNSYLEANNDRETDTHVCIRDCQCPRRTENSQRCFFERLLREHTASQPFRLQRRFQLPGESVYALVAALKKLAAY